MTANLKVHEDPTLRMVSHRNVMFTVWTDAPTLSQVRVFHRESEVFTRSHPSGQVLVNMVLGGVPLFTEPVRDELVKIMKQGTTYTLGTAHLILVGGMAGSAVRAFLSTAMLLARPKVPNRVFGTVADAAVWVHERLGGAGAQWTVNELRDALEDAKRGRGPER